MAETERIAANMEEAGVALAQRSLIDGDDFRVKILRRASPAALPESIAIFDGATVEHLLSPEPWLTKFAGGTRPSSVYIFQVIHAKDRTTNRASAIYSLPAMPGDPTPPNVRVVKEPGWNGPTTLIYPEDRPNGVPKTLPGSLSPAEAPRQPSTSVDGGAGHLFDELRRERERLIEDRHRFEVEAIRRAAEEDRKRLESKVTDVLAEVRERAAVPRVSIDDTMVKIITAMTPIVAPFVALMAEGRKSAALAVEAQQSREADREAKRQDRESALMEKIASQSSETAKVISVFTDSLAQTARAMVQTVAMVGELREPPQDEGIMGVLKTAIGAWAEAQASRPPQPALPPMAPRPAPPAPPPTQPTTADASMTPTQMIDITASAIRERTEIEDLAPDIVDAFGAQEFVAALQAEGGMVGALQRRLGQEWGSDQANVTYWQSLFTRVGQIAAERNVDIRAIL